MSEINVKKILDGRDSLWGFSNLIKKELRTDLREAISKIPINKFNQYSNGLKYSLSSNSGKFEENLFNSEPIQEIISIFESKVLTKIVGNLLFSSNTDIIQHIEYLNILKDVDKYDLIEKINLNEYKLTQIKSPNVNFWKNRCNFPKKLTEDFIISQKSIPYVPNLEISRIEKDGYIRPHTDVSRKIASIMIYLPQNNEQKNSFLGTTFWRPKSLMGNRVFSNNIANSNVQLIDKEYEVFKRELCTPIQTKFQDEYALLFFRSNTSWHSFEYKQNNIGPRLSININFSFPEIAQ